VLSRWLRTWIAACALMMIASPHSLSAAQPATEAASCSLRIDVDGLRNSTGVVGALLFSSADGWPEDVNKSVRSGVSPIAKGERGVTITIDGVSQGNYGLVVLHDENKNMKLDRNLFGWPKEGFGFANNPRVGLGPPPFKQAQLRVTCPLTETSVHILYK
jgi:uncharacterized protein (DUF2141 family)